MVFRAVRRGEKRGIGVRPAEVEGRDTALSQATKLRG